MNGLLRMRMDCFEGRIFFYHGIYLLLEKWEKVIASDGKYFK